MSMVGGMLILVDADLRASPRRVRRCDSVNVVVASFTHRRLRWRAPAAPAAPVVSANAGRERQHLRRARRQPELPGPARTHPPAASDKGESYPLAGRASRARARDGSGEGHCCRRGGGGGRAGGARAGRARGGPERVPAGLPLRRRDVGLPGERPQPSSLGSFRSPGTVSSLSSAPALAAAARALLAGAGASGGGAPVCRLCPSSCLDK
jgi:hypothetical protein